MAKGEARKKAHELWQASNGKASLKEIADELGVLPSKVRKWKSLDKWDGTPSEKVERSTKKSKNNSVGAPPGNQNAYKTGEYAAFMEDCLDDEEREFVNRELPSPLDQIDHEIKLAVVRERMVMKNLAELQAQRAKPIAPNEASDLADNVTKIAEQKEGKGKSSQLIVERRLHEKIIATHEALTRIQKEISRMIEKRHKLMKDDEETHSDSTDDIMIMLPQKEAKV